MLSNQSLSVHESLAPRPRGLTFLPLRAVIRVLNSSQVFGSATPAVLKTSGR